MSGPNITTSHHTTPQDSRLYITCISKQSTALWLYLRETISNFIVSQLSLCFTFQVGQAKLSGSHSHSNGTQTLLSSWVRSWLVITTSSYQHWGDSQIWELHKARRVLKVKWVSHLNDILTFRDLFLWSTGPYLTWNAEQFLQTAGLLPDGCN